MTTKKTIPFGPNPIDVRVRERMLANGLLDPKDLEKHLAELPDVAEQGEAIDLHQPAVGAPMDEDD
ncbi:MAG: hypothetical protein U0271_12730 [Polyangiaceae bacterium]